MNVHPVFLQCGNTGRSRVALQWRKRYSKRGDGITNISSRKEQVIFSEQWGKWFYQLGSGLSRKSEMKERRSMKALGGQAVGLGNNSVEGMIKSILDCTSHVPNSELLQLPFSLSGMSCPPISVCPSVCYSSNVPSFIPSSSGKCYWQQLCGPPNFSCHYWNFLHMCLTSP